MWIPSILNTISRKAGEPPLVSPGPSGDGCAEILLVTCEDRLFYSLFAVTMDIGWSIRRSRTFEEAWKGLRARPVPIVIYDERLPRVDWRDALRNFSSFPGRPLVFLAAPEVDEDIWRAVLRCHGYDAVKRSAGEKEWVRMLRFAWTSRYMEGETDSPGRLAVSH